MSGKVLTRKLFHGATATGTADTSTYSYDALGQLTGMTDTVGNDWSWTFDAAGREISAVDPDSGARSTTYDAAGRKASTTDAANAVIGYVYDDLDRVVKKTLGTGATAPPLETYTYDGNKKGQLSTSKRYNGAALNQVVTTTLTGYNAAYQPGTVSVQLPTALDAAAPTYTTTRSYTSTGQIEQETRPTIGAMPGETLTHVYNTFDLQTSVFNDNWDTFVGDTQFNHLGQMAQYAQYDNNNTVGGTANTTGRNQVNFTWDATTGRLTNQWSTNNTRNVETDLGKTTYAYNPAGKITARELSFTSRPSTPSDYQCYSYDHASRLAAVWTPTAKACTTVPASTDTAVAGISGPAGYAQTYTYTPAGDRAEVKRFNNTGALAVKETYTYPAAGTAGPHRVTKIDRVPTAGTASTQNFAWDTAGRIIDRAGQALTYTPDGHLATSTGASTVPANPNPNATTATPPSATSAIAAAPGERFYDADGNLVGIKDGTGTTITVGSVTAHTSTTNVKTATCTYTFAGKTIAERTVSAAGMKLVFVIGDTVNTAQTMTLPTTGSGPITTISRYTDPLGLTRGPNATATANNPYAAAPVTTAGVASNAANSAGFGSVNGYISGLDDTVSSLTHLGAREMDPVTGIFTAPDPILSTEDQRGFTPYTYAFGNVINTSDPSGLNPTCDCDDDRKGTYSYKGNGQYNDGTQVVQEPWYMKPADIWSWFNRFSSAATNYQPKWVTNGAGRQVARGADLGDPATQAATAKAWQSFLTFAEQEASAAGAGGVAKGVGWGAKTAVGAAKIAAGASAATKIAPFTLKSLGKSLYQSPAGLIYGPSKNHGHRLTHVLQHAFDDPTKKLHTRFSSGMGALKTVDEAWLLRGGPVPGNPSKYIVPMGKQVGAGGETNVTIIVRPGTTELITAFPSP
ncbi:RHS repeat-associated core domain-containing protein [Paenarthrobacter sp. AMU7]|uniref:RHS repeat-associated core domain-containing protein n=1 Tax=Paenarthrobacter sp. AMU7 TaxID=3162492 RepID=A0AB39YS03_9MICC